MVILVENGKQNIWHSTVFGATLSRRFARQIFTSFLSRKDLTKLKKQKNGFLFFVLVTTRYDRARQSQQKLQFCTLFLYSHKECTDRFCILLGILRIRIIPDNYVANWGGAAQTSYRVGFSFSL